MKPGDGVVFDCGRPEDGEEGGRIYQVEPRKGEVTLRFGHGDLNFQRIHVGDRLWKTNDPELDRRLRQSFAGETPRFQRPLTIEVHGHLGSPLTAVFDDGLGHVVQVKSTTVLASAEKQPLSTERLEEQLGRLGASSFKLGRLNNLLEGDVIIPLSELNELRRKSVVELDALRTRPKRWTFAEFSAPRLPLPSQSTASVQSPEIVVVIRSLEQLEAAWSAGGRTIYCEFEDPKKYRDAVTRFRSLQGTECGSSIWVAAPRVFKPGEEWILKLVRSSEADGYLVRNYEHLSFFRTERKRGDFSLNVANPLTAEYFLKEYGLERVTASYDLNVAQLEALLRNAPAHWFDITVHQHMPMFHMEHCVFCAFLSKGKDYHDCGRPCEKHRVALRDRVGAELPLRADAGCRNTVYNNRAQTGAEYIGRLLALGASSFRVEFLNETAEELARTVGYYRQLLRGEISGAALWRELKLINQLGVTRGQMETAPQIISKKI